jgi:hypothetical protein
VVPQKHYDFWQGSLEVHGIRRMLTYDSRIQIASGKAEFACVVFLRPEGEQDVSNIAAAKCEYLNRLFARTEITQQVGSWRVTYGVREGPGVDIR